MESKGIANANLKSRIKQIIILAIVIVLGVLLSQVVQAQDARGGKHKRYARVKSHNVMSSSKACHLLAKKRNYSPKNTVASSRKVKYKPMAEIDAPGTRRPAGVLTAQAE